MKKLLILFLCFIPSIVGAQTRPHWLQINRAPSTARSVKDWGAVGNGTTDDTLAIQAAIDSGNDLNFPDGSYPVSTIDFNLNNKSYSFNNATIVGIATSTEAAVVKITNRYINFYNLSISGNKRPGNTAAIHWYSPSAGQPAQWVRLLNLSITNCNIGILFGQLSGTTVTDAPQSENVITNYLTRGVRVPVYLNQPNGFLHLLTPNLDCMGYEYTVAEGAYVSSAAYSIYNIGSILQVTGGELLKTAETEGLCIYNAGTTICSNVAIESAACIAQNSGKLIIMGSTGGFFSNNATPLFENTGKLELYSTSFIRPDAIMDTNQMPLIYHTASSAESLLTNVDIAGWRLARGMGQAVQNFAAPGKVRVSNLMFRSDSNFSVSNNSSNLWPATTEYTATSTEWVVNLGGGSSAIHSIVAITGHPAGYASASQLVGEAGQAVYVKLPQIPMASDRGAILEYWIKHVSGTFLSKTAINYYTADGAPVGSQISIATPTKGEGSIVGGATTGGDWEKITVAVPPRVGAAYAEITHMQEQLGTVQRTGFVIRN